MINKLCLVLVVMLFYSCTDKYKGECDLSKTTAGRKITFKNVSGVNKIDKIVFSESDSLTMRYEFTESSLRKRGKYDYELSINDDLALMLMRGCVITVNDSIVQKISDMNVSIVTRTTMVRKIERCELVEYMRNDSIIKGSNNIAIPF